MFETHVNQQGNKNFIYYANSGNPSSIQLWLTTENT